MATDHWFDATVTDHDRQFSITRTAGGPCTATKLALKAWRQAVKIRRKAGL